MLCKHCPDKTVHSFKSYTLSYILEVHLSTLSLKGCFWPKIDKDIDIDQLFGYLDLEECYYTRENGYR